MSRAWTRATRRIWLAGLTLCAALGVSGGVAADAPQTAAGPASSDSSGLQQLLQQLGQRHEAQAHFQQSQYLSSLTRPLQSSGTLSYRAPDHLEQHIETPRPQQLTLDHGVLTMQLGRHRHSVPLSDYPQLAPLLDSLRALLGGDLQALQQQFELQFMGPLSRWQLRLTPRTPELAGQLRDIQVRGEQTQIEEIQIEQRNGDHSVMRLEP